MTTRELIETVRVAPRYLPHDISHNSITRTTTATMIVNDAGQYVIVQDYDALRAATLAVLDDLIASIDAREPMPWVSLTNARALRERVKG